MKNIFTFVMLLFCFNAYAAQTIFTNPYLDNVAGAWVSVLGGGKSGEIAARMKTAQAGDLVAFANMVSVLGYNDSALTLYEVSHHADMAYSVIANPLSARRSTCPLNVPGCGGADKTLVVDGVVSAASTSFDSNKNADFDTNNTSVSVRAKGYVADGFAFGVGYTRTMTDTHDNRVYTDATSNSITIFSEYLDKSGLFINMGINGGHTSWDVDKTVAGVENDGVYDTDFYSGQINGGIQIAAGNFVITPGAGVRYLRMKTERHIDAAAQSFDKWWYNTMTAMGGVRAGFDFIGSDFVIRPSVSVGGGYDVISHGNDRINVKLINGQAYDIPVDAPHRAYFAGGAGIGVYGASFAVLLDYKLDLRSDYAAHTGMLNLKIAF